MRRDVYLHGRLGERFGRDKVSLAVSSPAEAIRALSTILPGFKEELRRGAYRFVRGGLDQGMDLEPATMHVTLGKTRELHLVPVVEGAGGDGMGKVLVGVAIMAAAWWAAPAAMGGATSAMHAAQMGVAAGTGGLGATAFMGMTYGGLMAFGGAIALSGLAMALSPTPQVGNYGDRERPDERPSFLFNGPVNVSQEGAVRPLVFGEYITGSLVISSSIDTEQI